jgi:hypothetical protein
MSPDVNLTTKVIPIIPTKTSFSLDFGLKDGRQNAKRNGTQHNNKMMSLIKGLS